MPLPFLLSDLRCKSMNRMVFVYESNMDMIYRAGISVFVSRHNQ